MVGGSRKIFQRLQRSGFDVTLLLLSRWGSVSFYKEHEIAIGDQYRTPLDRYDFRAFAFVLEKGTTRTIPITMFAVSSTGPIDFTTPSFEEQTKTNFTYTTGDGPVTIEVESHTMSATIKHSKRARALTFSMFSINWVLTLCSVAIALIVLRRSGEVKDGVALLPITVILSIPTIRGIFVGSPPFGILLGAYWQNRLALLPLVLKPPIRRGRVLPANVDGTGMLHGSVVCFCVAVLPGQRHYR